MFVIICLSVALAILNLRKQRSNFCYIPENLADGSSGHRAIFALFLTDAMITENKVVHAFSAPHMRKRGPSLCVPISIVLSSKCVG